MPGASEAFCCCSAQSLISRRRASFAPGRSAVKASIDFHHILNTQKMVARMPKRDRRSEHVVAGRHAARRIKVVRVMRCYVRGWGAATGRRTR